MRRFGPENRRAIDLFPHAAPGKSLPDVMAALHSDPVRPNPQARRAAVKVPPSREGLCVRDKYLLIQFSNSACLQTQPRDLAARCARALRRLPPSITQEGAGKAGCALHPRSRVQTCTKKRTRAYRFSGGIPAFPARWFTAYFELSPVNGFSCHRHPREVLLPANLTPAPRRQDHTTSPSARVTLVSRNFRVHRIPPRVRDDREPPLSSGETGEVKSVICPTAKAKYFSETGWTGFWGDLPVGWIC